MKAAWHLDQAGRLGLAPKQPGYRPSAADLQQFQAALEQQQSTLASSARAGEQTCQAAALSLEELRQAAINAKETLFMGGCF